MYEEYIEENVLDVYGGQLVKLPLPQYIVFYNGEDEYPEEVILNLSSAFEQTSEDMNWIPALECRARVLNINYGHNAELMEKCTKLLHYAIFIQKVRDNQARGMNLEHALDKAIDECIRKGILEDILVKSKREVRQMILTEYNEKLHNKTLRAEGHAEGYAEGKYEAVLDLLEELGEVPASLKEKISAESDATKLTAWVKMAAKVESVQEFEERIR